MNRPPASVSQYIKQASFHAALLWKLGEVLQYNFFTVLYEHFPIQASTQLQTTLQEQVANLTRENDLYKDLIKGKLTG